MHWASLVVPALVLLHFASASVASAVGRVALVLSNSTDAHIGRLPNPENEYRRPMTSGHCCGSASSMPTGSCWTEALRAFLRQSAERMSQRNGIHKLVQNATVDVRFETVTLDDPLGAGGAGVTVLTPL